LFAVTCLAERRQLYSPRWSDEIIAVPEFSRIFWSYSTSLIDAELSWT
jgi:hypothetical protein